MIGMPTKKTIQPIFQDKKLEIYKDLVIIKDCYAPRLDKKLRISDIENVWAENLTFLKQFKKERKHVRSLVPSFF